jgi:hypothetical protein
MFFNGKFCFEMRDLPSLISPVPYHRMALTQDRLLGFHALRLVSAGTVFLKRQQQVLNLLRHLNQPLIDPELSVFKNSFSPLNNLNKFKVTMNLIKHNCILWTTVVTSVTYGM